MYLGRILFVLILINSIALNFAAKKRKKFSSFFLFEFCCIFFFFLDSKNKPFQIYPKLWTKIIQKSRSIQMI